MILQFVDTVIKHGLHYFGPQIGNSRSVTRSIARSSVLTTNSLSTLPTLKICTVYYNLGSSLPSITFTRSGFSQDTIEKNKGCFFSESEWNKQHPSQEASKPFRYKYWCKRIKRQNILRVHEDFIIILCLFPIRLWWKHKVLSITSK